MKAKKQQRNGHACHAIMRKDGVHEESKTGKRRKTKNDTQKQIQAWRDHAGSLFLATNLAA